jgi:diguanylate cyclase (GGDEF)-like protein
VSVQKSITPNTHHSNEEGLLSLIQEMIREEDLLTALNIFTQSSLEIFGCSVSCIYLRDECCYSLYSSNTRQEESLDFLQKLEFPKDFGVNWVGTEVKDCIQFQPNLRDLSHINEEWVQPFRSSGFSRLACMPLIHFGQMLGVAILFGKRDDNLDDESVFWLKQAIPVVSSFVYEYQLRLAAIDREQALTLLLRGTEILVQADSEEQLLTEAGEMAMEILFLPGGFFLLADPEGKWEIRAPFGRLKQTDWDWQSWVSQYIPQAEEISSYRHTTVHYLDVENNPFQWERVLIQPLQTHSGIVGELWLMNGKEHEADQRQEILAAFVRIVGVAFETIRQREELARLANTDRLTGILNRQGFEQRIREEMAGTLRRESTFLLLVLDLDLFKQLNDSKGHPAGDLALKSIAQNLRAAVREEDIVARTGGDEFTVVLTDVHRGEEALLVIERMRNSMRLEEYGLGVSIGVAEFPMEGRDFEELYRLADFRLYRGKNTGKGKIILN